mmetsp:Transcript_110088/g.350679  ORF Transcript_110088/g.350679 Transcript_110088/m.350679 type:complete len:209 (+) Transcript_110088:165-791(+)
MPWRRCRAARRDAPPASAPAGRGHGLAEPGLKPSWEQQQRSWAEQGYGIRSSSCRDAQLNAGFLAHGDAAHTTQCLRGERVCACTVFTVALELLRVAAHCVRGDDGWAVNVARGMFLLALLLVVVGEDARTALVSSLPNVTRKPAADILSHVPQRASGKRMTSKPSRPRAAPMMRRSSFSSSAGRRFGLIELMLRWQLSSPPYKLPYP